MVTKLNTSINSESLLNRLQELGQTGKDNDNKLSRVAASDADKAGRDKVVTWMKEAGLEVEIDRIGNIFGTWYGTENRNEAPILLGSHIDTVINSEQLVRFEPVIFDENIVKLVEEVAGQHGLQSRRMTSGAGQDAQVIARVCPSAMIFVPSVDGISHNPKEFTAGSDLVAGANVLIDVVAKLTEAK